MPPDLTFHRAARHTKESRNRGLYEAKNSLQAYSREGMTKQKKGMEKWAVFLGDRESHCQARCKIACPDAANLDSLAKFGPLNK